MKVITVTTQKGGVGKTTTAWALYGGLRKRGFTVLAVDLDPQGSFTYTMGAKREGHPTALGVLTHEVRAWDAIQETMAGDIIAASPSLAGADSFLTGTGKEYKLKEALKEIEGKYDYCVIDTPPSLGILTVGALTACRKVVIPAGADILSLQGIDDLYQTIAAVKQYTNPGIEIDGILLTRYNARTVIAQELKKAAETLAAKGKTRLYTQPIREAVIVKETQLEQKSLFDNAELPPVAADYEAFISELLEGGV